MNVLLYYKSTGSCFAALSGDADQLLSRETEEIGVFPISNELLSPSEHWVDGGVLKIRERKPSTKHQWIDKAWQDTSTLEEVKIVKREEIKKARNLQEFTKFIWNNHSFDSDQTSQQRLNQACQQALLASMTDSNFSRNWTLSNGEILEDVTAEQMLEICSTLANYVNNLHTKSQELYKKIDEATTLEEVAAITWQ
jgi:hypothetical protein